MWPRSIIAAWLAPKRALTDGDATGSAHGLILPAIPSQSAGLCGRATIIAKPSKPDGALNIDLTPRAYRLANRNRAQAERYLSLHKTLSRGVCLND